MNKYKELRILGKGSFGRAILVQELATGNKYVIKIIQTSSMKPKEREEALQEAEILEHLKHPNIIAYKESFEDARFLYIVMEYANSGDLYELIKKQEGNLLEEALIWEYFVQICLAVKHIHDRRILHRDLKTQNVFLTEQAGKIVCKIGDFGVSKILSSTMECAKTAIGTPYYLSPELCNNEGYNNKSDIWALGCILYEMCTLQHTFEAANMKMLIVKILEGKYKPISQTYSNELHRLLTLLLEKDPKKRPSVNSLLRLPELQERIDKELSIVEVEEEFAHTAFHGKGNVLRGFDEEREIKAIVNANLSPNEEKNAINVFASRPELEGANERVGVQIVAENKEGMHSEPPSQETSYVPSDETLLNKFNELDLMLRKSPTPSEPPSEYSEFAEKPTIPASEIEIPAEKESPANPLGYAPPVEYQQFVSKEKENLNEHQREVVAKLAPMSDRDRARYAREKELADKHAKAEEMRKENKENIAKGQQRIENKYNKINQEYDKNLRVKREQMYRDEEELNARKVQMLENKAEERLEARNEMLKQERKNQEIAENERLRRDREREKLHEMMAEKRKAISSNAEGLEIQIVEKSRDPDVAYFAGQETEVTPNANMVKEIQEASFPEPPEESSQSFGDQPDVAFEEPFNERKDWQNLLNEHNEADSLCYRMESLKEYLEKELGFDRFLSTYQAMQEANEKEQEFNEGRVEELLGSGNLGWMNLIVQLILVEKRFNECE